MYNTTECFQDPHGPPKAETQLFPSTAERTTQIWGVCVGGGSWPPVSLQEPHQGDSASGARAMALRALPSRALLMYYPEYPDGGWQGVP